MQAAPSHPREAERLEALRRYQILDTAAEESFDEITRLAAQICETPISLVSLVDEGRQWFKARTGLKACETPRSLAFCAHAILQTDLFVINDAAADPRFSSNPLVTGHPHIRFYAGAPLVTEDGHSLGTLCVIDRVPHELSPEQRTALTMLAHQVMLQMELRRTAADLARLNRELDKEMAERRRAEEGRTQLLERERAARAEAEAANRAKDVFLATVSHELRTPLTAVLGYVEMLRLGMIDDEEGRDRALEIIERNAKSQEQLVKDILDVSRIISGKMRLDVRALDLHSVVRAAADVVRPALEAKKIELSLDLDPNEGLITGDPDRLQQVVWNLLSNAAKFTPEGGRVCVRLARVGFNVEVTVTDTGCGIRPDFLPFVFEHFRQAENVNERVHRGLGLGLAIVRHLVELHGGTVTAESAGEGCGATFTVRLPLNFADPAPRPEDRQQSASRGGPTRYLVNP